MVTIVCGEALHGSSACKVNKSSSKQGISDQIYFQEGMLHIQKPVFHQQNQKQHRAPRRCERSCKLIRLEDILPISLKLIMNHPIAHSNPPGFQILRQC